jgi:probable phosphoglycerate mutase
MPSAEVPATDAGGQEPKVYRQERFLRPPGAAELLLVRHGASAPAIPGAPFDALDGQGDPPLDPVGHDQALKVAARLAVEDLDAIYVTTLRRTAQTAAPLAARLGLEPVVEPDLREVFLGDWEGGAFRQHVAERHPIAVQMFTEGRWDVIPGAEPSQAFAERVHHGIMRIAERHREGCVAVFTHGGVIAQVVAEASGARPFAFIGADNASVTHLVILDDGGWRIRCFNDAGHLHAKFSTAPEPLT